MMVFVHIPKTAGTSFTRGLEVQLGKDRIAYDFGTGFSRTSDIVREKVYTNDDYWGLRAGLENSDVRVLSGHFEAKKYQFLFPITSFVTFLREPVQRFYSEYCHRKRRDFDRFDGSFMDYCKVEKFCNIQSRLLQDMPWSAFGFLGLTESYNKSLDLFESYCGIRVDRLEVNQNNQKGKGSYELSDAELSEAIKVNKKDCGLFKQVKDYFNERIKCYENGSPFVMGQLQNVSNGNVFGFACSTDHTSYAQPVEVEILINGSVKARCLANQHRKRLQLFGVPRNGFVGFSTQLELKAGDRVAARVADTKQLLASSMRFPG